MKGFLFAIALLSTVGLGMTQEEADKYVSSYESMTQKVMGFMNCISRALTGQDAIQVNEETNLNKLVIPGSGDREGMGACFQKVGFRLNGTLAKIFSFGAEKEEEILVDAGQINHPALRELAAETQAPRKLEVIPSPDHKPQPEPKVQPKW